MKEVASTVTRKIGLLIVALGLALVTVVSPGLLVASDHDDGEVDTKGRNLNLTDLYAFREVDQNSAAADGDLIFIMNLNPRSLARQQYYFSTKARYQFHVTRVAGNNDTPTGKSDVVLRFEFGAPQASGQQSIRLTAIRDGATVMGSGTAVTTPLSSAPIINRVSVGGTPLTIFAGLREDPFFFDVEQYFRVRAGALGIGPAVGFRNPGVDFTAGYNVLSVAVRVPRAFLQGSTSATTFDVWETIWYDGKQVERLGRPAINEGLIVTNDYINALNSVGPDFEADALAGKQPAARIAGPIVAEAKKTLMAVGNNESRANALLGAFLPDVLRIDTTAPSGYANALSDKGSPIRGRKITDDVIDITLTVVTNGAIKSDGVSYAGPNAGGTGHKPLLPAFPYLADPN
ncbi:MAG: DUF4331 domain-containing protein [Armatimonadetes bacterium]|nr:DUF4331 domain-containing protein [Armatimonadota bacterium]